MAMRNATYDRPHTEIYFFPSAAFGATTATRNLKGPDGLKGKVVDIMVDLSADCVGTTTVPEIDVGTASGDVSYARYRLGTSATAGYTAATTPFRASQESIKGDAQPPALNDYAGHVQLETALIPADTVFVITEKAGVGGTPAGTGTVSVVVEWF